MSQNPIRFCEDTIYRIDETLAQIEEAMDGLKADNSDEVTEFLNRVVGFEGDNIKDIERLQDEANGILDNDEELQSKTKQVLPDIEGFLLELREWLVEGVLEHDRQSRQTNGE